MYGRARMRYVSRQVLFRESARQLLLKEFDDGPNFCPTSINLNIGMR